MQIHKSEQQINIYKLSLLILIFLIKPIENIK